MDTHQLTQVVDRLRRLGLEPTDVEVKAAVKETPHSLRETLSAFRNGKGGLVILGLEENGFVPAVGFDANRCRDGVAGMCSNDIEPPLRASIEAVEFEGTSVVTLEIEEADVSEKPVFVKARGRYGGSFIRGGDGDRRLSEYEVSQLMLNRGQPTFDREPVEGATLSDLDPSEVDRFIDRLHARGGTALSRLNREETLRAVGVVADVSGDLVPTLGGLLVLGRYPQQFFPQLNVTLVVLPTTQMGQPVAGGKRFLDNRTIDGPIPSIVDDIVVALTRNLSKASIITGAGRSDSFEYPLEVIREAVVNALMHRDYSPASRGSQVQVELYPDRLVIRNSGGLFGGVDTAQLGEAGVSSSRNASLARILADAPMPGREEVVCENRGSGIPAMFHLLRAAGMTPPKYKSSPSRTTLTIPRHGLLDDATIKYIAGLGTPLSDAQAIAVGIMRSNGEVSNENLRGWGVERLEATQALADLVAKGIAYKQGGRRYATYRLTHGDLDPAQLSLPGYTDEAPALDRDLHDVLTHIQESGPVAARDVATALGTSYQTALRRINRLLEAGRVSAIGSSTSKNRVYEATKDPS